MRSGKTGCERRSATIIRQMIVQRRKNMRQLATAKCGGQRAEERKRVRSIETPSPYELREQTTDRVH